MVSGGLGKQYRDGEIIYHQGELGQCMYVIQKGHVEETHRHRDQEFCLAVLNKGDFFGEAALFENDVRTSTVRAAGDAIVLALEKDMLLHRMHREPWLAFSLMQSMSNRIRALEQALIHAGSKLSDVIPKLNGASAQAPDQETEKQSAVEK